MEPRPHKDTERGEAPRHFSPDAGFNMFGIVAVSGGFLEDKMCLKILLLVGAVIVTIHARSLPG
jgi:hypothetical protein